MMYMLQRIKQKLPLISSSNCWIATTKVKVISNKSALLHLNFKSQIDYHHRFRRPNEEIDLLKANVDFPSNVLHNFF